MPTKSTEKLPAKPPSLKSLFPHEHTLIPPLFQYLSHTHTPVPTPLIAQELEISRGIVRADIALLTDHLHGFEIKAGNDSLTRLPLQIQHYDAVFQYNWLITTPNHLKKAQTILPPWWGILVPAFDTPTEPLQPSKTTSQDPQELTPLPLPCPPLKEALSVLKPAALNPSQLPLALAKLLWKEELLSSLKNLNLHKGNSTLNKQQLYKKLILALPLPDLNHLVLHTLRNRTAWRAYPLPPQRSHHTP